MNTHSTAAGLSLATNLIPDGDNLKIVSKFVSTEAKTSIQAHIPKSRSYLKIVDVPYPVTKEVTSSLTAALELSVGLAAQPRVMCNSRHSDTTTVWFNIWDSQSGSLLKKLVNQYITICNSRCVIRLAKA
ncbi:hypothetical protein AN958_10091 [Leucoagaricus sp. SymC.cos]|nr:hypothetical protein AN958_10091 [Leucoagaricus sp. SymC.cos]